MAQTADIKAQRAGARSITFASLSEGDLTRVIDARREPLG